MTLDEAVKKDYELRAKLLEAIAQKHQLEARALGKVEACALGNWLHGEAERKFVFIKSYRPCADAHAAFHAEAEKVARLINLEEYAQAEAALADGSPYVKAFGVLLKAVLQLKKDARL
ncbi:MAG TPA: CZB domain-containing protein [Paucimonas sp.]|nr:CZB domain-containing protein [Paucimonas sp.]